MEKKEKENKTKDIWHTSLCRKKWSY